MTTTIDEAGHASGNGRAHGNSAPVPADSMDDATRGPSVGARARDRWVALALALASALVRVPFQSDFLVNFDSVNFAFGLEGFDLEHHEPHPPGYLGYVVLVRGVRLLTGDANRALTVTSVVAAGLATALVFLLARRMASRRAAVIVAVLFTASPLAWYYGVVGLSYLPATVVTLGIVWACHHARFDASVAHAYAAGVFLAGLGAMRQTDIVLFAPLLWWATAPLRTRVRVQVFAVVAGLSVLWLVPLLVLSGGLVEYIEQSRDLAELAGGRTSVFGLDPGGLLHNLRLVSTGVFLGLFAALAPMAAVVRRGLLGRDERRFLLIWVVPPMAVFLLVHTGQLGYVLPVVPAAYLVLARGLDVRRARRGRDGSPARTTALVAALVVLSVAATLQVPSTVLDAGRADRELALPFGVDVPLPEIPAMRPIDVRSNDAHWRELTQRAGATDPDRTAMLTPPNTSVSFRHLSYYEREHWVFSIGEGRDGTFGHLFSAKGGETDYTVDGLSTPSQRLELPATVTELLAFDFEPDELEIDAPADWDRLDDGTPFVVIDVPTGGTVTFSGGDGDTPTIGIEEG